MGQEFLYLELPNAFLYAFLEYKNSSSPYLSFAMELNMKGGPRTACFAYSAGCQMSYVFGKNHLERALKKLRLSSL